MITPSDESSHCGVLIFGSSDGAENPSSSAPPVLQSSHRGAASTSSLSSPPPAGAYSPSPSVACRSRDRYVGTYFVECPTGSAEQEPRGCYELIFWGGRFSRHRWSLLGTSSSDLRRPHHQRRHPAVLRTTSNCSCGGVVPSWPLPCTGAAVYLSTTVR